MGKVTRDAYQPDQAAAEQYDRLFAEYTLLHDYFGRGGNDVMHRLSALRREGHRGASSEAALHQEEPKVKAAQGPVEPRS